MLENRRGFGGLLACYGMMRKWERWKKGGGKRRGWLDRSLFEGFVRLAHVDDERVISFGMAHGLTATHLDNLLGIEYHTPRWR